MMERVKINQMPAKKLDISFDKLNPSEGWEELFSFHYNSIDQRNMAADIANKKMEEGNFELVLVNDNTAEGKLDNIQYLYCRKIE